MARGSAGAAPLVASAFGCGASPSPLVETTIAARPLAVNAPATPASSALATAGADCFVTFPERGADRTPIAVRCGAFVVHRDERDDGRVLGHRRARRDRPRARAERSARDRRRRVVRRRRRRRQARARALQDLGRRPLLPHRFRSSRSTPARSSGSASRRATPAASAPRTSTATAFSSSSRPTTPSPRLATCLTRSPCFCRSSSPSIRSAGRWKRSTPRFRAYLAGERRAAQRDLDACNGDATCQLAWAEKIAGLSVLLGDWSDVSPRLALPAEVSRTTSAAAIRLAAILRARGEPLP